MGIHKYTMVYMSIAYAGYTVVHLNGIPTWVYIYIEYTWVYTGPRGIARNFKRGIPMME